MDLFQPNGHLTDGALNALTTDEALDELSRLELSEHLSYCDCCLQRYMDALETVPLLTPAKPCKAQVRTRIRRRSLRQLTTRYATAAAAVALALTMVWSSHSPFTHLPPPSDAPSVTGQLQALWDTSMQQAQTAIQDFFDGLKQPRPIYKEV